MFWVRCRIIIVVLFFAAFVVLNVLSYSFASRAHYYYGNADFVWNYKIKHIISGNLRDASIVILGDSRIMGGILPRHLATDSALIYNLGLPSQQPEGLFAMAQLLTTHLPRLKTIFININHLNYTKTEIFASFRGHYRRALMRHVPLVNFKFPSVAGSAVDSFSLAFRESLPFMQMRRAIRPYFSYGDEPHMTQSLRLRRMPRKIAAPLASNYLRSTWAPYRHAQLQRTANTKIAAIMKKEGGYWIWGSTNFKEMHNCSYRPVRSVVAPPPSGKARIRKDARLALRAFLESMNEKGIRVVILRLPASTAWNRLGGAPAYNNAIENMIESTRRGLPGVVRLRLPQHFASDPSLYRDWAHLNYCGAKRYTEWLRKEAFGHRY